MHLVETHRVLVRAGSIALALALALALVSSSRAEWEGEDPAALAANLCAALDAYASNQISVHAASGMVAAGDLDAASATHRAARDLCEANQVGKALMKYQGISLPVDSTIP